jgi:hypothetical protein
MNRLIAVTCALALSACAFTVDTASTADSRSAQQTHVEKEYRTGSRIPMRNSEPSPTKTSPSN